MPRLELRAAVSLACATEWGRLWSADLVWLTNKPDSRLGHCRDFRSDPAPLVLEITNLANQFKRTVAGASEITNVLERRREARYEDEEGVARLMLAGDENTFVCELRMRSSSSAGMYFKKGLDRAPSSGSWTYHWQPQVRQQF